MTLSISSTTIIAYLIQEINDYFPELFPGARRANAWAVDNSVNNVDNWEFGEFGEFVGQEPNNSVYLAPFTMPCGEPCGLIGKFFARPCIVIRGLVIFIKKRTAKLLTLIRWFHFNLSLL